MVLKGTGQPHIQKVANAEPPMQHQGTRCARRGRRGRTVEEQDGQVGEDNEEEEEDEGDGSTHATFVADLTVRDDEAPTTGERTPSRRTKPDKPGEDEGEDKGKRGGAKES